MADSTTSTTAAAPHQQQQGNGDEDSDTNVPPLPAPGAIKPIDRTSVARICSGQVGMDGCMRVHLHGMARTYDPPARPPNPVTRYTHPLTRTHTIPSVRWWWTWPRR